MLLSIIRHDLPMVVVALHFILMSRSQVYAKTDFEGSALDASNLSWTSCYSSPLQCSRLTAPLNYSNPNAGSISLALIRIPSPLSGTPSYRGPILFNPGGPGGSGVQGIAAFGAQIATAVGPEFDVVSFDPRGVGNSTPSISFFNSDIERAAFDFGPNQVDAAATPDALPRQWAHFQVLGRLAQDRDNGILAHVTTDNVARDMLHIVEALGQTKLKYWGISYGSVLGATFASLFPDKVDRLIIDGLSIHYRYDLDSDNMLGVLDMEGYYSSNWANEVLDTDKVLQAFFDGCFKAGPKACAFYDKSPAAISHNLDALYKKVIAQPIVAYSPSLPTYGIIDYATLKNAVFSSFYSPYNTFAPLAQGLSDLRNGNGSLLLQLSLPHANEVITAIACGDAIKITDDAAGLQKYTESISNISSFSSLIVATRILCSGWRIHPNNFRGPIKGNTSFPLLLIGNTADPVAPLSNAIKTSKSFPGSVVLTQDSPGHTSFSIPSECTIGYIKGYFQNGTLPTAGTVCSVAGDLFPLASTSTARNTVQPRGSVQDVINALRISYGDASRVRLF
ncbi:hypothetical protein GALMADRAFT_132746 [Galerina marginata CBS 339.88]|uniref:Uncharacterized protein n=1 Tax=Galerina marginata (strain CBS 339.88) TaxID=685588 RepID=A0A067TUY1_GALM3|nr:hypothetical protein GALMADRAFT_132746 [Galerina marginata CBS 339.88]